jgi:hypothetical protein
MIILGSHKAISVQTGKVVRLNGQWIFWRQLADPVCSDFEVHDLPNITFSLPRNWAGNIPVNRANHPNDTLFFWAFEKEDGSLTRPANDQSDEPWGIWMNGG